MKTESFDKNLYEESWEWLGQIILAHDVQQIDRKIRTMEEENDTNLYFQYNNEKYLAEINDFFVKERKTRIFRKVIPRVVKTFFLTIGLMTFLVGIALASNSTARMFFARLITEMTPEYTTLRIEQNEEFMIIPSNWTGTCFPTRYPEGTVIRDVYDSPDGHSVSFHVPGVAETLFTYEEITNGTLNIDTEDATISDVSVNGITGKCVIKDNHITIYWMVEDRLSLIYLKDDQMQVALDYAEGVRRIQR